MFTKKMIVLIGVVILVMLNIIMLTVSSKRHLSFGGAGDISASLVAPFQSGVSKSVRFVRDIWRQYFFTVSVAKENERLKKELSLAIEKANQCLEIELSNDRLRAFLDFQKNVDNTLLAAETVGRDPSPWFQAIIIDKGRTDGVTKNSPVVLPEGIVGQVIDASEGYSKVLMITDLNSAVDAIVQRTRARGVVRGKSARQCILKYALRKNDIQVGDTIISSGLDGVYPKGLRVGSVSAIVRKSSGIFQEVIITPYADFGKIEEVLVVIKPPENDSAGKR